MYVSNESPEQVEARLRKVMANAELRVLPGDFAFVECPVSNFPNELVSQALMRWLGFAVASKSSTDTSRCGCPCLSFLENPQVHAIC